MTRLRWTEVDTNWWAAVGLVSYEARVTDRGTVRVRSTPMHAWYDFNGTLEEAKQAALDDYRGRILDELDLNVDALAKEAADAIGVTQCHDVRVYVEIAVKYALERSLK